MIEQLIGGVSFFTAKDSANETWLATGQLDGMGLEINDLKKVETHNLSAELGALQPPATVGLGFPFSAPINLLQLLAAKAEHNQFQSWQEVVEALIFTSIDDFATQCRAVQKEAKRLTNCRHRELTLAPFSKASLAELQTTYYGMRFLATLDPQRFSILPFQDKTAGRCTLIEVCPVTTLWCFGLQNTSSKSKEKRSSEQMLVLRSELLRKLTSLRDRKEEIWRCVPRLSVNKKFQHRVAGSDRALDAIIACYCTAIWAAAPELYEDPYDMDDENVLLEGWLYAPASCRQAISSS